MTRGGKRRPQAVVDTNVLVSGIIVPHGLPHLLLDAWEQERITLITAPPLIAEVERILHKPTIFRKYHLTEDDVSHFVDRLRSAALQNSPVAQLPIHCRDPKDDEFLAVALGGAAEYLVTGDNDLLSLRGAPELGDLQIVTVRDFLDLL